MKPPDASLTMTGTWIIRGIAGREAGRIDRSDEATDAALPPSSDSLPSRNCGSS